MMFSERQAIEGSNEGTPADGGWRVPFAVLAQWPGASESGR